MVNATDYTQPRVPASPYGAAAQALVTAWDLLAQPEQQAPNTYGDIINSLRGNPVAGMYQRLIDGGMPPAQAQASIRQMATWLGAAATGGGIAGRQALAAPAKAPATSAAPPGVGTPTIEPPNFAQPAPGGWGGPGGTNPTGNTLAGRVPTNGYAAQLPRVRQLLGLSPVAMAIQTKLRGG